MNRLGMPTVCTLIRTPNTEKTEFWACTIVQSWAKVHLSLGIQEQLQPGQVKRHSLPFQVVAALE